MTRRRNDEKLPDCSSDELPLDRLGYRLTPSIARSMAAAHGYAGGISAMRFSYYGLQRLEAGAARARIAQWHRAHGNRCGRRPRAAGGWPRSPWAVHHQGIRARPRGAGPATRAERGDQGAGLGRRHGRAGAFRALHWTRARGLRGAPAAAPGHGRPASLDDAAAARRDGPAESSRQSRSTAAPRVPRCWPLCQSPDRRCARSSAGCRSSSTTGCSSSTARARTPSTEWPSACDLGRRPIRRATAMI